MIDLTPWMDLWPFALATVAAGVVFVIVRSFLALVLRLFLAATLAGVEWSPLVESHLGGLPPWCPDAAHVVTALILGAWLLKARLCVSKSSHELAAVDA